MRIAVRTGGLLGQYLPEGSARNSAELEVPEGASVGDAIAQLAMPPEGGYLVIHNGATVPKGARAACRLAEGDELAIMPPLKGG
jgi:sulfur carrier protein ThiS